MPEFSALIGKIQLKNLEKFLKLRRLNVNYYRTYLKFNSNIKILKPKKLTESSF